RVSSSAVSVVATGGRSFGGVDGTMASPGAEAFSSAAALGSVLTGETGAIEGGGFETTAGRSGETVVSGAGTDEARVCARVSTAPLLDASEATTLVCEALPR